MTKVFNAASHKCTIARHAKRGGLLVRGVSATQKWYAVGAAQPASQDRSERIMSTATQDLHTAALAAACEAHGYDLSHAVGMPHVIAAHVAAEYVSMADTYVKFDDVTLRTPPPGWHVVGNADDALPKKAGDLDTRSGQTTGGPVTVYRIDPDTGERILVRVDKARQISKRGRIEGRKPKAEKTDADRKAEAAARAKAYRERKRAEKAAKDDAARERIAALMRENSHKMTDF